MINDPRTNWMLDQIKFEANAIRKQISGLPKEAQDEIRESAIRIIRDTQKGDKHEH